ncbi:hypothetical protein ACLKA6_002193 [Drosophila palustris]
MCGTDETAEHVLSTCPRFDTERTQMENIIGGPIEVSTLTTKMLEGDTKWSAVCSFAEIVGTRLRRMERERNSLQVEAAR